MYKKREISFFQKYNMRYQRRNVGSFILNILTITVGIAIFLCIQSVILVNKSEIDSTAYTKVGGDAGILFNKGIIDQNTYDDLSNMQRNNQIEYSSATWMQGMISAEKRNSMCTIRYIDPESYPFYKQKSDNCDYTKLLERNSIIISKKLANSLNVKIGMNIVLQGAEGGENSTYQVAGIAPEDGEDAMDMNIYGYVFLNREVLLQKYGETAKYAMNKIYVKLIGTNLNTLKETASAYEIQDVNKEIKEIDKQVNSSSVSYSGMGVFAVIISFIGIISSMLLLISKRQKDICIFKVFGATAQEIVWLFMKEVIVISLIGIVAGTIIGTIVSYFICYFLNDYLYNIIMIDGYISVVLKISVIGMLFAVASSLISVMTTIQMKPVSILRGVNTLQKGKKSLSILRGILITICLCVISSLYLKNMVGALIIIIAALVYLILTTLAKLLVKGVSLLFCIKRKTTIVKIAAKYLRKNCQKFSLIVLVLSICVSIIGTVLLMYNSIQPSLEKQVKNSLGYDALFKIGTKQEQMVNEVLKNSNIDSYFESAILDFTLKEINGVLVEKKDDYEYSMDCMYGNVSYVNDKIVEGNTLSESSEKREVVVAQDFYKQYKLNIGDVITIQSGEEEYTFTVIGVRETENIKTGQLYTSQVNVSDIIQPKVIRYYIQCKDVESFVEDLNGLFDNIVVLNIQDISAPYADTINKELLILKLISVLCIGSAIFLVFNILTVTYIGDKRQYLIYGMYGADKRIKRMMIVIQGIILGIAGAMLSVIIGIFEALLLEMSLGIHLNYDLLTFIEVCILSIVCAEGSTLLISSTLVNYNDYKVLRSE